MSRGQSSVKLEAAAVAAACKAAVAEIEADRAALLEKLLDGHRRTRWYCTRERALQTIPEHMKMIADQHREHDEELLRALWAMARAGRVIAMTADDFRLIRKHFNT
jgi:isopropylmalate/homocitrate/citramalate synthase